MPTKKMTVEFIRGYTGGLETAGMNTKNLQKRKVGELNASVTKAVNTKGFPKSIRNRWLKMVLKHEYLEVMHLLDLKQKLKFLLKISLL